MLDGDDEEWDEAIDEVLKMMRQVTLQERRAAQRQAEQTAEWLNRFNPFRCTGCGVAVALAGDLCDVCLDVFVDESWIIEWFCRGESDARQS